MADVPPTILFMVLRDVVSDPWLQWNTALYYAIHGDLLLPYVDVAA
jgi:hypothetical protein